MRLSPTFPNPTPDQVIAACGHQTLKALEEFAIPYDEIHFGQPFAHVYVDASVASSSVNTAKDLGWRVRSEARELEPGMVAARHFNNVRLEGDYVVKTASRSVLRGEIFFYQHMPIDIAHLFPTMVNSYERMESEAHVDGGGSSSEQMDAVSSLTLQRIKGVTFSHLITNRCLTPGRLSLFLTALRAVHSSVGDASSQVPLRELDMGLNCEHCTALTAVQHCTALCCAVLHCTALCCTALHCVALRCTALCCAVLHCTALCCELNCENRRCTAHNRCHAHSCTMVGREGGRAPP